VVSPPAFVIDKKIPENVAAGFSLRLHRLESLCHH
jgi:hypothetical protein